MKPVAPALALAILGLAGRASAFTGADIATLASANVGKGACSTNSHGATAFESSCTGNAGQPEYWCADFAQWVWAQVGAGDTSSLDAAVSSFVAYGKAHGTLSSHPAVGDAVFFYDSGTTTLEHVAIVIQVNTNGTIETVSGDWGGESGSEAHFASTSHVVLNDPAYAGTEGTTPSVMGMTIGGFVSPLGIETAPPADAGAGTDAGTKEDAGTKTDAGATEDAGAPGDDAGRSSGHHKDAGSPTPADDAGALGIDPLGAEGGASGTDGDSGGGGCAMAAPGSEAGGAFGLSGLGLAVVALGRRGRRARR